MTSNIIPRCRRAEYVAALVNRPWAHDGPHCWQLVIEVERELFGRALPALLDVVPLGSAGLRLRAQLFRDHDARAAWREVAVPEDGAIALMHRAGASSDALIHAGVFLALDRHGVLHCDDPCGVVFDSTVELRARHWVARWFVPRED